MFAQLTTNNFCVKNFYTNMVFIIGFIGVFFALIGNMYWYRIKGLLKKNGYNAYNFHGHSSDLGNFQQLINSTNDVSLKNYYKKILFRLRVSIALIVLSAIVSVLYMSLFYAKWDGVSTIFYW